MANEKWQKVRAIFDDALRRPLEERHKFIHDSCDGDQTLIAEVESLLSSLASADSFMETPAIAQVAGVMEAATNQLQPGKSFGHYEIIRPIGKGGMGEVYLATDKKLDRQVAVKILNEKLSQHEANLHRFTREAKAASSLNHLNILVIYEIGEADETHYIVSEFINGKTLREIGQEKSLPLSEVLDISMQIANALCTAHEAHLVHRDIKPENIMIRPDGLVKVLDFGLAKFVEQKNKSVLGGEEATLKQNERGKGVIFGTVNYMSPEQAKGERVDERTDIFSFGTLVYEMIAGRTPFAGSSIPETLSNLITAEPQPFARLAEGVPDELQRIVATMLRKNKDERYQTMKDVLTDLRGLREHRVGRSKRAKTGLSVLALLVTIFVGVGRWQYLGQEKAAAVEQLHFKADFYLNRLTDDEAKKGIQYFNQAIALDPNSAPAYAGLSGAWIFLSDLYIPPRETMPKAKTAALNALQRDEIFASAHISLGIIKMRYEWDWIGAEHEFKQAIALDPKDDVAHLIYGWYLIAVGRFDEAQAEMKQAVELNPLEAINLLGLGHSFYFAHQSEQSIEQYRRAIGVEPKSRWSHLSLGQAYAQQSKFSEAIAELNQARLLNDNPLILASLGHTYAVSGQVTEAQKIIAELQEIAGQRYVSPYDVATIYAGLGEKEQALMSLEKAYEDRSGNLALYLKVDPKFDSLRDDPRFRTLLRRVGLPE